MLCYSIKPYHYPIPMLVMIFIVEIKCIGGFLIL